MPLSEVINVARWNDPEWLAMHRDLATYSVDPHCFHTPGKDRREVVRKGWEWTQCIYGLEKLNVLRPGSRALGVGAGREPVIFWLSSRIEHVTATDLYGNETWSSQGGAEAAIGVLNAPEQFCPRPVDQSKIVFANADGTNLPYPPACFDIVWSLSSIEHFGGHLAATKAVREMARVLRPGGVACIATEFLLLEEYDYFEFFTRSQVERDLIGASSDLALVDGISWDLPPTEFLIDSIKFPESITRMRRHVVLNNGDIQWTSIILFLRKL